MPAPRPGAAARPDACFPPPAVLTCDTFVPAPPTSRALLTLHAPGRLHLGFLDPAGTLGRRFGSLGVAIDGYETVLELTAAARDGFVADDPAAAPELDRVRAHVERLRELTGCRAPLQLRLLQALPAHAGFGSGTQLALAIGRAFAHWHGIDVDTATLAGWLERGRRSGIGIAAFDHGGLLLDAGPGADGAPAPLLARLALPADWRIVVVEDTRARGLCGHAEASALASLPALPRAAAAEICHEVLMRVLAGAATVDFGAFAAGVTRVQRILGGHYAPAQGGVFASVAVGRVVEAIGAGADGGAATGQSSWGPTGFAILPSQAAADAAVAAVHADGLVPAGIALRVVRARNRGATLAVR